MNYLVPDKKKPDANTDMNMDKQKARDKKKREHLLPEHAHENPWKVAAAVLLYTFWSCCSVLLLCCSLACQAFAPMPMPPLLFFVQSLYDLINKILNEAGAAHAHDVYNNLYPANNGRLRPHKDRTQVL